MFNKTVDNVLASLQRVNEDLKDLHDKHIATQDKLTEELNKSKSESDRALRVVDKLSKLLE